MPWRNPMSLLCALVFGLAVSLGLDTAAKAQMPVKGRVALVIGNSEYQHAPRLPNPASDARAVGGALERLGFTVTQATDLGFDDMRQAILKFGRTAQGADIATIYFAGHGIEFGGENWIVPTDADLQTDLDVDTAAINLKSMMKAVSDTRSLGLIILDACRTNPFQLGPKVTPASLGRGMVLSGATAPGASAPRPIGARGLMPLDALETGLAPVDPVNNVLVAFAARDGTVAQDGEGQHSPFTSAILSHIEAKDLEINFLFRNVRDDVLVATRHQQEPFIYGSLSKDAIFLNPAGGRSEGPPKGGDEIAWAFLKDSNEVDSLQRFVDAFPQSPRAAEARARIDALQNPRPTVAALFPSSGAEGPADRPTDRPTFQAEARPEDLARQFTQDSKAVDLAWTVVKTAKSKQTIEQFVNAFPTSRRRAVLRPPVPAPLAAASSAARSARSERARALAPAEAPWLAPGGEDRGVASDQLVAALSRDYEIREDRRAKACDLLAADPDDAARSPGTPGTPLDAMDGRAALAACRKAVTAFPDVPRYRFQLCRALTKVGRVNEARAQCEAAVETAAATAGAAPAQYMTFETINNIQSLTPSLGIGRPANGPPGVGRQPGVPGLRATAVRANLRQALTASTIANRAAQAGSTAPGDRAILARVRSATATTANGRRALRAAGESGRPGALNAAARQFGASARALREGARIARIEAKPQIARALRGEAMGARLLAVKSAAAARQAVRAPMVRVMAPRMPMIKIKAPKIVIPKIQVMVPHIVIKHP